MIKQNYWVFVWRERGLIVSKEKVFSSTLENMRYVHNQIEHQVTKPVRYPDAVPTVLGRFQA